MKIFTIKTESGRWLGWPEDRPDIIASGETKEDCIDNIKYLHNAVIEHESGLIRGSKLQPVNTTTLS